MSEFFSLNLLGIIGIATGLFALLISYRTYSKQKPNLNVKVTNCEYTISFDSAIHHRAINFSAKFQIKNVGDRGTNINDIVLSFKVDGKEQSINPFYTHELESSKLNQRLWIEAHGIIDIEASFNGQFDGTEEDEMACIFTISDTHKTYRVRAISKNTRKPLV
jgi:hypothetical protein